MLVMNNRNRNFKTIPFITASKNLTYLGINITEYVQ